MATHKSSEKRHRQSLKRQEANHLVKVKMRNAIREVKETVQQKNNEEAQKALFKAIPVIDKAASKGVIHWRNASRKVSRLTHLVQSLTTRSGKTSFMG